MKSIPSSKFLSLAAFCLGLFLPRALPAATAQLMTRNALSSDTAAPGVKLGDMLQVSEEGTRLDLSFTPVVKKSPVRIKDKTYSHFQVPAAGYVEKYGYPRLPFVSRLVAIPDGMEVAVSVTGKTSRTLDNVSVEPAPPDYQDNEAYKAPPVQEDAKAYASETLYPPKPYEFVAAGRVRGVRMGLLRLYPLQYRAAKKKLTVHDGLKVRLSFQGQKVPRDNVKWTKADAAVSGMTVNPKILDSLYKHLDFDISFPAVSLHEDYVDLEFLIVTHPDFKDAADALAEWKNEKGIKTIVRDLDTTGATVAEIEDYVEDTYNLSGGSLKYLMILGDSDYVPTDYYAVCDPADTSCTDTDIATDLPYAEFDGDDFAELAYGRLPANSLAEADAAVAKILSYEQDPPAALSYYENFTFAGYFQDNGSDGGSDVANDGIDDRSYIETQEAIRDALVAEGKTVDRVYTAGSTYLTSNPDGPQFYEDGVTPLPSDLLVAYDETGANVGYAWDGDTTQITDDFNSDRALLFHRDHGNWNGWSSPSFKYGDLADLTNTAFPVVFSINCITGRFDHEIGWWSDQSLESFAEQALTLPDHGPASLVAASRATSTSRNNTMSKGLFDALWDDVVSDSSHLADDGSDEAITRLGDVLNYAKLYVSLHHSSYDEHFRHYYVVGDPTLEILRAKKINAEIYDGLSPSKLKEALTLKKMLPITLLFPLNAHEIPVTVKLYFDKGRYVVGKETAATVIDGKAKKTYAFDLSEFAALDASWFKGVTAGTTAYSARVSVTAKEFNPLRFEVK